MPDITSPQAVRFCNEDVRPLADVMVGAYDSLKAFVAEWDANGLGAIITNTVDMIADNSDQDGRYQITGAKVNSMYTAANSLITWFETGTPTRISILRTIAVNPRIIGR